MTNPTPNPRGASAHAQHLKIVLEYVHPPIPIRNFDWCATFEGYEPGDAQGFGVTEQEAVDMLLGEANMVRVPKVTPRKPFNPNATDTFADGYGDAMQGLPPQCDVKEYAAGYDNLKDEVSSGFADLWELIPPSTSHKL